MLVFVEALVGELSGELPEVEFSVNRRIWALAWFYTHFAL